MTHRPYCAVCWDTGLCNHCTAESVRETNDRIERDGLRATVRAIHGLPDLDSTVRRLCLDAIEGRYPRGEAA